MAAVGSQDGEHRAGEEALVAESWWFRYFLSTGAVLLLLLLLLCTIFVTLLYVLLTSQEDGVHVLFAYVSLILLHHHHGDRAALSQPSASTCHVNRLHGVCSNLMCRHRIDHHESWPGHESNKQVNDVTSASIYLFMLAFFLSSSRPRSTMTADVSHMHEYAHDACGMDRPL
eukprot:COSAG05_NODE_1795_length_4077_cov_2.741830_6_plen_172_part_00